MNYINFIFENEIKKYQGLFESFCPPPLKVAKKTDLLKQCQTVGWLYYLIDGVVKVYITNYEGNEHIVDLMRGGTLIGMDCVTPGSRSVVSISALTDIRVLPFNMDILKKMLAKDPDPICQFSLSFYRHPQLSGTADDRADPGGNRILHQCLPGTDHKNVQAVPGRRYYTNREPAHPGADVGQAAKLLQVLKEVPENL